MSLHLNATPMRQASPMSCWWACMRMVLEYYGQHTTANPRFYRQEFERPFNRPVSPVPDSIVLPDGTTLLAPYEWYAHGVPPTRQGLQMLCEITGFRGVAARPAFGSWSTQNVEDNLRTHGPYLFVGNWNRQGFHAVLVVGREVSSVGAGATAIDEVIYIDPAVGMELRVSLEHFNGQMSTVQMSQYNPLYYPTPSPVRATVPPRGAIRTYTVAPGDTLSAIAQRLYGNARDWPRIYEANQQIIGRDENLIHAGQVLVIP